MGGGGGRGVGGGGGGGGGGIDSSSQLTSGLPLSKKPPAAAAAAIAPKWPQISLFVGVLSDQLLCASLQLLFRWAVATRRMTAGKNQARQADRKKTPGMPRERGDNPTHEKGLKTTLGGSVPASQSRPVQSKVSRFATSQIEEPSQPVLLLSGTCTPAHPLQDNGWRARRLVAPWLGRPAGGDVGRSQTWRRDGGAPGR